MRERITAALREAMLGKDKLRVSAIRLMLAAIKDRDIALRGEDGASGLDDAGIMALLAKMVKQREESAATYEAAGRMELAQAERAEITVIKSFLPKPMSADEIETAIKQALAETGASSIRDMGKVMGALKAQYPGQMDFAAAGGRVKAALG
ncbi:MAG: GatB/YqeY domain-containing protein [Hyphomicrobiales bacterium]|nr:MAG: GatB/YqeY domain-containing protein [Hyphomicrobiales bacterium]